MRLSVIVSASLLAILTGGLAGCAGGPAADTAPFVPSGCGDGIVDPDEACDDGAANDDATPDACRTDCLLPTCGDGVVDAGEACDDGASATPAPPADTGADADSDDGTAADSGSDDGTGGPWGGDGCDAACAVEDGTLELEPNDTWDVANVAGTTASPVAERVDGALPAGDTDCWSFPVDLCGAVEVRETAPCTGTLALAVHDPIGALLAVGTAGADGCAVVDPAEQPGARWVTDGTWSVCASALTGGDVRSYALSIATVDAASLDAPVTTGDLDDDGAPDSCDPDRDGDGLDDIADDCAEVSNGPASPALALSGDGFVRDWLGAGPFTTGVSAGSCRPSDDFFVGEDAPLTATVGDAAGTSVWSAKLLTTDAFDLLSAYGTVDAPREAYALVYLRSDTARTLTLAVGADDGLFAWWNGARVLDVAACQGVNTDQFTASVDVTAGWNTLLLKVYDQGGGWGLITRFFDAGGAVVTDLEPSLTPGASWIPDQSDGDGDGLGDACDPEP